MTAPSVGTKIVEQIAELEGVDPMDLDVRLYDVVDIEALHSLVDGAGQRGATDLSVEFEFNGYAVSVTGNGGVTISPATPGNSELQTDIAATD